MQLEDTSPRKSAAKANEQRNSMFVTGISCVHPTDSTMLVEVGVSERGRITKGSPIVARDAEQAIKSLSFHRFNEQALQKSAEAARTTGLADAEAVLKPYVDADAAWARYFLAQIIERARPAPENAGVRIKSLLEPAAEKGLADAQWSLGTLYLRGRAGRSERSLARGSVAAAGGRARQRRCRVPARHRATLGRRWDRCQQERGYVVGSTRCGARIERSAGTTERHARKANQAIVTAASATLVA